MTRRPTAHEGFDDEPLTEELLEALRRSASPEEYLDQVDLPNRDLPGYLFALLDASGKSRAAVADECGMGASYVYQIFAGERTPTREFLLRIAFCLGCDLRQAQRLLRLADEGALWPKRRRDAILIFCLEHGYDLPRADAELYRLGERILTPERG